MTVKEEDIDAIIESGVSLIKRQLDVLTIHGECILEATDAKNVNEYVRTLVLAKKWIRQSNEIGEDHKKMTDEELESIVMKEASRITAKHGGSKKRGT